MYQLWHWWNRDCSKVLQSFKKKWHPKETRCDYEKAFSTANWKALHLDKKQLHTLANCKACHKQYPHLQLAYPQGPYYEESILSVNTDGLQLLGEKKATRQALAEINTSFTDTFNSSFTELLVKHEKAVQKKPTPAERKKKLRSIYRRCRDQENESLKKAAAIAVLTEDESQRAYQRKRKRQYFDTPPPSKKPKVKSHLISLMSAGTKRKYSRIYSSIHSFRHLSTGNSLPGIIMFLD